MWSIMTTTIPAPKPIEITPDQITFYRENGFVKIEGILTPEEVEFYHAEAHRIAVEKTSQSKRDKSERGVYHSILNQTVNAWRQSDIMKALTLHPNVTSAAKALAGVPLRLWHDHVLAKDPHNGKISAWHQDQPFWPHRNSPNPLSCWMALIDVPERRGCMSFIPKAHRRTDLAMQNLHDSAKLFSVAPDLEFATKITEPLRAGDCTFHHGLCPHMANANDTDEYRIAHVAIFMDRDTEFDNTVKGKTGAHILTDSLGLNVGDRLEDPDLFPEI